MSLLPGYGVPSPQAVHAALQPRFRQVEQHCRDWCERPASERRRPLMNALGGMVVLARLCRQPVTGERARRTLRLLRGQPAGQERAVVVQCLVMLDGWAGQTRVEHHCQPMLAELRDAALGALRLPQASGGALPGKVCQYLALRDCLTARRSPHRSDVRACRTLLDDGPELQGVARRLMSDMALSLDAPLSVLGADADCPDRMRGALHALYRELSVLAAAHRLHCLIVPAKAVRQAQWLIAMHLRQHPDDWPTGSRAVLIRHLLALQGWLLAEPEEGAAVVDLSPVMRRTGRFLRAWWQAPGPGDEVVPWLDAQVRRWISKELRGELCTLTRTLPGLDMRPVSPALCTALARLHLTLSLTGYRLLAWWSDSLQQALLTRLQAARVAGPAWRRRLVQFRSAVLAGPVQEATSTPDAAMVVDHGWALLEAVADEARLLTALRRSMAQAIPMETPDADHPDVDNHGANGVREPPRQKEGTVIDQLSGGMTCLPDPAAWFSALAAEGASARRMALMRSVARELAVLEKGARALGVPRIEALAAVLRSVYRQIGAAGGHEEPGLIPDRSLLVALRRGHAGLLHRLDQAAAWQTISRPQPVIEYLYRCLEEQQSGQPRGGLSLPQRCLSINRRLQALLEAGTPAPVTGDRRTLMLTLMQDQARLLKTMAAPHRNRPGQGV